MAQPRNAIFGQLISSIIGVAVCKLFQLNKDFESIRWLGGSIACAVATAVMALTKTVHPPAGATALLAVVDDRTTQLGWFLVPVMLLGCCIMLVVALLLNNIERRYPVYWFMAEDLSRTRTKPQEVETGKDEEAGSAIRVESAVSGHQEHGSNTGDAVIVIEADEVSIPEHVHITEEDRRLLESVSKRLG